MVLGACEFFEEKMQNWTKEIYFFKQSNIRIIYINALSAPPHSLHPLASAVGYKYHY